MLHKKSGIKVAVYDSRTVVRPGGVRVRVRVYHRMSTYKLQEPAAPMLTAAIVSETLSPARWA
jgi:hypothetical protein